MCNVPVFGAPSFNKRHPNSTHSRKLINCFKSLGYALREKSSKFLVIEDFQIAPRGYLTYRRRMPTIALIAIGTLNED